MRATMIVRAGAAALLACLAAQAQAQVTAPAESGQAQVYETGFFAEFAPVTALDIARRIPGFTLDLSGGEVRGFGGAAGNVVINGARPSSKSESLESILQRIPARRVVRVEVTAGERFGAEYVGRAQVANIILSAEAGLDANLAASLRRRYDGHVVPNVSGSALYKSGVTSFGLAAGSSVEDRRDGGTDTLVTLPGRAPIEFRRKVNPYTGREPFVSANFARESAANRAVRLNARYEQDFEGLVQRNSVFPVNAAARDDRLFQDFAADTFELGGDITRPFAGGAIKLIGLATRSKRDNQDSIVQRSLAGETLGGFAQEDRSSRAETIARLVWSRQGWDGWSIEMGAEGALNRLDSDVDLFAIERGGARRQVDLPIDEAVVSERRGEVFAKAGRALSPKLRADAGVTFEYSNLTVRGDAREDRTLQFLKPQLTLDWRPGDGWRTQLAIRRTVAQLNFFDFISDAEFANDRVNSGNAELLPQRAWEVRATVEKPVLGDGLAKLELGYDRISKLQDRVLTPDGFDAPGNLGTGTRAFASASLDAPLVSLGLRGVRLKLGGTLQETRVEDPLTGEARPFSDFYPEWQWNIDLRRDAGTFSYGFTVQDRAPFAYYRINEIDTIFNDRPYATAFIEYRPRPRTAITFDIDNALDTVGKRRRIFFAPTRAGTPAVEEFRERNSHLTLGLTVKQTFG